MNPAQTVLLVEDSEDDRGLIRVAFEKAECDNPIQEVRDGEEDIAYLQGEGGFRDRSKHPVPALVLLDLKMPRSNGFEFLTWARSQPALQRIPIIILPAPCRGEDVQRAFDLGASALLVKPVRLNELASMISRMRDWLEINQFPPGNHLVNQPMPINSLVETPP